MGPKFMELLAVTLLNTSAGMKYIILKLQTTGQATKFWMVHSHIFIKVGISARRFFFLMDRKE
ncbi:hypothetical protein RHMOL_Rhmol05G0178400 [Rhododendron molle]|uniref:Uncharacterized protein n=1 Tax=Rhododendron molle TaxID=49168 RepID=A0ACC0NSD3_RHOML|nr:hypothetical protein RHMOL_Rhmol05G0178400 [Rhododendron molle]